LYIGGEEVFEYTVCEIMDNKHRCFGNHKKCGVYKITNIKNNKIYIGSSKNILQRWKNHIKELEKNKHKNFYLQHDWNEYKKDSFIFEVLIECSEATRYSVEQEYLNNLMPFYRTGTGYNISEKATERNETNVRFFKPDNPYDNYFIVKTKGCKPHLMDVDYCNNMTKEDLEWKCIALDMYYQIRDDMIEQNGYDDWEW